MVYRQDHGFRVSLQTSKQEVAPSVAGGPNLRTGCWGSSDRKAAPHVVVLWFGVFLALSTRGDIFFGTFVVGFGHHTYHRLS